MSLDLDERTGWPDELLPLLKRHPRESWRAAASPVAEFWLERHDDFRRRCRVLETVTAGYGAGRLSARELAMRTAPRMQSLLGHLHGHHQVEDFHYFPFFKAAEPRLAAGFDALEQDHRTLHAGIDTLVRSFNVLAATLGEQGTAGTDAERRAAERYVDASMLLYRRLLRHLDHEEDLIIPLMLERA